jgi:NAD(P)-dependent dehydrogenase (short-subunit alcohol dehydrogenase family)
MSVMTAEGRRVCLLTGAGGRLGTAFLASQRARYDIALVQRTPRAVASPAEAAGAVLVIESDLERAGQVDRVVELALARFGRVDLLVNAAAHSVWAPIVGSRSLLDSVPRQFAVNVAVPLQLAAALAQNFWRDRVEENRTRSRNVVNLSSLAGVRVFPGGGRSVYAASKAALNVLTAYMADEFSAFGVRANALAPDSFPRRVATEAVCDAVVHLDEGSETGLVVIVDAQGERPAGARV